MNNTVWVRDADGLLASRAIHVVWRQADDVVAKADFERGDMLVVSPLVNPVPGAAVRVREDDKPVDHTEGVSAGALDTGSGPASANAGAAE